MLLSSQIVFVVVLPPYFPGAPEVARCRVVDQPCLRDSLGHRLDAVLYLPMHSAKLLLEARVSSPQNPTTITN